MATSDYKNDPYYAKVLRELGVDVTKLPRLDLQERCSDYIDFLDTKEMTHPVMRFADQYQRKGIAIHLVGKSQESKPIDVVLTIHERYQYQTYLVFAWGHSDKIIEVFYRWTMTNAGGETPFNNPSNQQIFPSALKAWLNGDDPHFGLPSPLNNILLV